MSNVRLTWIVEAGIYGDEIQPLLVEIRRQGMEVELVPFKVLQKGLPVPDGACVIAYGTFPFARQVQLHSKWSPGAWANLTNLECTTYFAYVGRFLLNQPYIILPGAEAIRQQDWIYETFGPDEVFVRPSGCTKIFTGRCIYQDDFSSGLSVTRFDPATLVVIASPRQIQREWRLVVAGDEIVAASQYALEGAKAVQPGCPGEVTAFVEAMLREVKWRPDPIFMMDVCESDGRLWLVELNGFSCSWIYGCGVKAVVDAVASLVSTIAEGGQGKRISNR